MAANSKENDTKRVSRENQHTRYMCSLSTPARTEFITGRSRRARSAGFCHTKIEWRMGVIFRYPSDKFPTWVLSSPRTSTELKYSLGPPQRCAIRAAFFTQYQTLFSLPLIQSEIPLLLWVRTLTVSFFSILTGKGCWLDVVFDPFDAFFNSACVCYTFFCDQ
jgi:hypothetical protein